MGDDVGGPVDAVAFGKVGWWSGESPKEVAFHRLSAADEGEAPAWRPHEEGDGWQLGVQWQEPRDIARVVVRLPGHCSGAPPPRVQYWQRAWPAVAPERLAGARHAWLPVDDHFHGQWVEARAEVTGDGDSIAYAFDPLDIGEIPGMAAGRLVNSPWYGARARRTLKLRLLGHGPAPESVGLSAFSGARRAERSVDLYFGLGEREPASWDGRVEAHNGRATVAEGLGFGPEDAIDAEAGAWRCRAGGSAEAPKGVRLRLLCAAGDDGEPLGRESGDRTIVTVRSERASFSFLAADVAPGRPVPVPDLGVAVVAAGEPPEQPPANAAAIYDRVAREPEQTPERAFAEVPLLDVTKQSPYGRYLPLGIEANRQEFALRYNGNIVLDKRALKVAGRDSARLLWPGVQIRYSFASGDPPDFRERPGAAEQSVLDGYLPVVTTRWLDRDVEYTQVAFAAPLDELPASPFAARGDEDLACLVRVTMRNVSDGRKTARLWFSVWPGEHLALEDGNVVAGGRLVPDRPVKRGWRLQAYPERRLRAQVDRRGRGTAQAHPCPEPAFLPPAAESLGDLIGQGEPAQPSAVAANAILYQVELDEGEQHSVDFRIPFATLTEPEEWRRTAELDFDERLAATTAYWRRYLDAGMAWGLPDGIFADFLRAVRAHVAISVDRDPGSSLDVVPAATYSYGACGNEACLQIRLLDMCGHHERAARYLETFIATQGVQPLDGNFRSQEGTLQALDLYDGKPIGRHFSYNLDHGFIMECLADHYRLSGDEEWLRHVAPNLVEACDFVTRERRATMLLDDEGNRVAEYGLLPAGHLEDNPEWQHWFAVNGRAHGGMRAIAEVLARIGHPEAQRLAADAAAYREDTRVAMSRARIESPVVRLGDGTYVPHLPTRTGIRGREHGWFREGAYGALHLVDGGVLDPDEPEVTWMLRDLEDNVFVTWAHGWATDLERYWFSRGGVTVQGNLLGNAVTYLRRGQRRHAVRSLLNNAALNLYRDVRAFTEHPVIEPGHGVGPFYKTPDEAGFLVSLRRFLVLEEGDDLHLAPGLPAAWLRQGERLSVREAATWFGVVGYEVRSLLGEGRIEAEVALAERRSPSRLWLHLPHPEGKPLTRVWIDDENWTEFDATGAISLPTGGGRRQVVAFYS